MTGLASGFFAGLAGTMVLEIHCPILDARHILLAHIGVLALLTMIGLAAGFATEKWGGLGWSRKMEIMTGGNSSTV
jgi:hypothetical protein